MTNDLKRVIYAALGVLFFAAMFSGCEKSAVNQAGEQNMASFRLNSFRDIPGVTEYEKKAVENLQKQFDHFVYGTTPSSEAFITEDGEIGGFVALFCDWLTALFGIRFEPEIMEWGDILAGLKTGDVDFSSLMATDNRIRTHIMTDPIAERSLKTMRIADSVPLDKIASTRPVRYVLMEDSATIGVAAGVLTPGTYEVILTRDYDSVYNLIKGGDADAFIEYNMAEAAFGAYGDVLVEDFLPLVFSPVSMAAENPELAPIISLVTMALKSGGIQYVNELYKDGHENYIKNQFLNSLNAEERAYLQPPPVVPVLAENWFYPLNYYNKYEKRWEGIAFDVLDEVSRLTKIAFEVANTPDAPWAEMFQMMNDGKVPISLDLIYTPERSSRYLWSKHKYLSENYALISKHNLPNINIGEIQYAKIGLIKSTGYAEMFQNWFPEAANVVTYDTQDGAFLALDRGEVDLVMAGTNALSSVTNYYELSSYKANYIFNSTIDYVLVYNKNYNVLCSVVDKALDYIDIEIISKRWESKTFDYQSKLMRAQRPWLIGAICVSLGVLVLILVSYQKNRLMKKQLEIILNNVESGILIIDAETRVIMDINPVVTRMFGGGREQIVGQRCEKLFCVTEGCPILEKGRTTDQSERQFKNAAGEIIPIIKSVSKINYNGRIALLESFSDISHIKKAEEAKSASEAKTRFIANMSHEMRTPMNVVVGLTDLMLEENEPVNVKENLKKINTAGNTLLGLISDVLDMSKIEAGKLELTPVQYDVASLLNDIITLNMIRLEERPITFRLDITEELPSTLYGDDLRVKQIVNNILSNAFKYTRKGNVTLGMSCTRTERDDIWASFYVTDTGIGIRPEDLDKLFSDYNQLDTRANRNVGGTGLGLSITKRLVELMEGEITVESEYGVGTTFRVRIRQRFVNEKTIGKETVNNLCDFHYTDNKKKAYEKFVRPDLSYARVMVVDDMQSNLDVAASMLRKYKMHVDCVLSGQAAIEKISIEKPVYDAIFMDHMMPEMDGVEAAAAIRALGTRYAQTIPIIALTANAIAGNEQMFLENGFQAFLPKPINIMSLDLAVRRWVRDKSKE
jgi:PAS domain S-box-containing protein